VKLKIQNYDKLIGMHIDTPYAIWKVVSFEEWDRTYNIKIEFNYPKKMGYIPIKEVTFVLVRYKELNQNTYRLYNNVATQSKFISLTKGMIEWIEFCKILNKQLESI